MSRDLLNTLGDVKRACDPIAATADADGITVDTKGYTSLMFIIQVGIEGITLDGSNYIRWYVEKSANDSTWTDCADGSIYDSNGVFSGNIVALTNANAETPGIWAFGVQLDGNYRYYRLRRDHVGTHGTATPLSACAVLGGGICPGDSLIATPA